MTIEYKTTMHIDLSQTERDALRVVDTLLRNLQDEMSKLNADSIVSATTGQLLIDHDIAGMRGILGGIADCRVWEGCDRLW